MMQKIIIRNHINNDYYFIENTKTAYDIYNEYQNNLSFKNKIKLEAIMAFGLTQRALDFINGYFNRKYNRKENDIKKYGHKTFARAQKLNDTYIRNNKDYNSIKKLVEVY